MPTLPWRFRLPLPVVLMLASGIAGAQPATDAPGAARLTDGNRPVTMAVDALRAELGVTPTGRVAFARFAQVGSEARLTLDDAQLDAVNRALEMEDAGLDLPGVPEDVQADAMQASIQVSLQQDLTDVDGARRYRLVIDGTPAGWVHVGTPQAPALRFVGP